MTERHRAFQLLETCSKPPAESWIQAQMPDSCTLLVTRHTLALRAVRGARARPDSVEGLKERMRRTRSILVIAGCAQTTVSKPGSQQ